jgi:signal transduction histidine kinase/DNA-binding response OmpR family regulator
MEGITDRSSPEKSQPAAKILVVDDRPDKLLALQAIIEELEETVFSARSGDEALKLVLEHDFAVVLLDVNMPGLDGLETAALIRQRKKSLHTPIIFITAYPDEMLTMKGYSLGAVDYILSPVVPEILRTKVKVFVDLFRMTQSAKQQAEERIALAREQAARTAAEEASRRSNFLAEGSRALSGSLDFAAVVQQLFSIVVPSLADVCTLTSIDQQSRIERTELAWSITGNESCKTAAGAIPIALEQAVAQVLTTGKARVIENVGPAEAPPESDAAKVIDSGELATLPPIRSAASFPLTARGRIVGVLCLALGSSDRAFRDSDLSLIEDLANRAAIALDNALLYEQLQKTDHQKNEFLAVLGHELRNPLAPIRNAVEILRIAGSEPDRLIWARDIIERQVKHLARLVDDLLDVSRITRGKIRLQLSSVDVSQVLSAAVETSMPLISSRRHRLTISPPPQPLWIKADFGRIAQVIANLLNNAAKYTPEGGRISLAAEQDGEEAVFRVTDTGVGLPKEMLSNIFDLFARDERAANSFHDGLGVGLTLVRRLIEIHGGSVHAFSAGPEKGSEFSVRLPVLRMDSLSPVESSHSEPPSLKPAIGLRVLIVEDKEDAAECTGELLRLAGCEVQLASDGPAALKSVGAFRPDAVLLDIGLPGMDGYEVARRLRARPSGEQLILIAASGYGQEQDRQRSLKAGFDTHLTKPFDPAHLTDLLISLRSARRKPVGELKNVS